MGWRSGQSYSQDLRDRVLGAVDGGMAVRQVAVTFQVSIAYIYKALIRRRLSTPSVTAALPVAIATGLKSALESELRSGRWVRSRCFRGRSVGGDGARRSGLRFSPQRFSLVPALPTSHASMTSPPP